MSIYEYIYIDIRHINILKRNDNMTIIMLSGLSARKEPSDERKKTTNLVPRLFVLVGNEVGKQHCQCCLVCPPEGNNLLQ
jgi:hypothetical protein